MGIITCVLRLDDPDRLAMRQALKNGMDYYFNPATGCFHCIKIGVGGCHRHAPAITKIQTLRRRLSSGDLGYDAAH